MNRGKSVKLKTCIFENINNIDKTLAKLTKIQREDENYLY